MDSSPTKQRTYCEVCMCLVSKVILTKPISLSVLRAWVFVQLEQLLSDLQRSICHQETDQQRRCVCMTQLQQACIGLQQCICFLRVNRPLRSACTAVHLLAQSEATVEISVCISCKSGVTSTDHFSLIVFLNVLNAPCVRHFRSSQQ